MPDDSIHSRRRLRAKATLLAVVTAAIAGCGTAVSGTSPAPSASTPSGAGAEDLRSRAEAVPGIDEARLVYVDPDGSEHPDLPADAGDSAGWVARIDLVHDLSGGSAWASETVDGLVELSPESVGPRLEIWLDPTADADVSALAYPLPAGGGDPVRDAYLMAATPGVVRSVFDGQAGDVRVRDESDLAKVADVAVAQGVRVDTIRTADDDASLEVAAVPARPAVVDVPAPWPDDPAAPPCAPEVLHLALAGADAATGHRGLTVSATNTGGVPCAVEGYPELGFRSIDERPLDVTVTLGGSFMGRDPGAVRVVIPPGARVLAIAGWNAMSTAGPDDVTAEVLVAAAPGAPAVELPLTSFALSPEQAAEDDLGLWRPITSLDILDTGEVAVTAWAPTGTAF